MKRSARAFVVLLVCFAGLCACSRQSPEPVDTSADIAAIRALLGDIEQTFAVADLEAAMELFTDDAVLLGEGLPDIAGTDAIRATYAGMLQQFDVEARLNTAEVEVVGDLAYERGTYTLKLTDKVSGRVVSDTESRHIHILRRQPDGQWKTWRMMVNSAETEP